MCDQHLYKSPATDIDILLWTLQRTITLTENALLNFLQTAVEKLLAWQGIELTTSDLKFSVSENR